MSSPPSAKRQDIHSSSDGSQKKRRKGATRLSCAECRRSLSLLSVISFDLFNDRPGSSYDAIGRFHVAHALKYFHFTR